MDVLSQLDPNKVLTMLDREYDCLVTINGIEIEPDGTVVLY
jgi:hypothetical protein